MKSNSNSCIDCKNKNCLLYALQPKSLEKISTRKIDLNFSRGQYVFMENHPVNGIYFIKSGIVKVFTTGINDKKQIVRLASAGHVLGHRGYGSETYPISSMAITESLLCFVDNTTIYESFMQNPELTYALMMFYSRELRKTEIRMKYLGQMTVREKVAEALLYLQEIYGINIDSNTIKEDISRQEIAELSGTNADEVTRQYKNFEQENLISRNKRKITIVNPEKLEKIVSNFRIQDFFEQQ